jgi:hypothetical protein
MKNFRLKYGMFFLTIFLWLIFSFIIMDGSSESMIIWCVIYVVVMIFLLLWLREKGNLKEYPLHKFHELWSDDIKSFTVYKEGLIIGKYFVKWNEIKSLRVVNPDPSMKRIFRLARILSKGGPNANTLIIKTEKDEYVADVDDFQHLKKYLKLHIKNINLKL